MFKNNQLIFFTFFDFFYMFDFFYTFLDFFYNFFCENDFTRKNCKKNQRLKKNSSYCFFLHTVLNLVFISLKFFTWMLYFHELFSSIFNQISFIWIKNIFSKPKIRQIIKIFSHQRLGFWTCWQLNKQSVVVHRGCVGIGGTYATHARLV